MANSQEKQPQKAALMSLARFELFSDGVFAIAMTLLIIEIKPPDLSGDSPAQAIAKLLHLWPHILGYITSFLVIGVVWINHHALFHFLKRVDRISLIINLVLLLCVAFVPFPTALLGSHSNSWPVVVFYGLSMALVGVAYNALWFYAVRQYIVTECLIDRRALRAASLWTLGYPAAYLLATALALVSLKLSLALYVLIPIFYLLPGVIDKQLYRDDEASAEPTESSTPHDQ